MNNTIDRQDLKELNINLKHMWHLIMLMDDDFLGYDTDSERDYLFSETLRVISVDINSTDSKNTKELERCAMCLIKWYNSTESFIIKGMIIVILDIDYL